MAQQVPYTTMQLGAPQSMQNARQMVNQQQFLQQQQQQQPQQQQPQQHQHHQLQGQLPPHQSQQPQQVSPPGQPQEAQPGQPARPSFQVVLQPPPQDRLYPTFEACLADVKAYTRSQGYAVVIVSSLNRDSQGQYRRYNLGCSKGGKNYTSHSKGIRNARSTKTGCPMRLKAVQEKAPPYNDQWHIVVQCAEHNHEPFTGGPGVNVPSQFRKIEQDGIRWLMIMHREAQCTLRQLTIGIRISFGDKYQYVKKSDVRNTLAKIKRDEDRKAAAAAAAQGIPSGLSYTLIPASHLPPPPPAPAQPVEQIPQLPADMQVPDPDWESDDDEEEP